MAPTKKSPTPRKKPTQARAQRTVEWILESAAQIFRAEGFGATTNRIAARAGVSIGTLYEYFPNKEALLFTLAERHVIEAERGIATALSSDASTPELLRALQAAILTSHRYPSQALKFVHAPELKARVAALRQRVLAVLEVRAFAAGDSEPRVHARVVFGLVAELGSMMLYEGHEPEIHARLAERLLAIAVAHCAATTPSCD